MVSHKKISLYNKDGTKKTFEEYVRGNRVAVVGNALSLFEKELGNEIDSHDIVIRFNKAAPLYLTEDVSKTHGTKTNVWAFWAVGAFINKCLNEPNTEFLNHKFHNEYNLLKIQISKGLHRIETKEYIDFTYAKLRYDLLRKNIKRYEKYLKPMHKVETSKLYKKPEKEKEKFQCSAGIAVLNWLLESKAESVDIYGMDFKRTPTFSEIEIYERDMRGRIDQRCNHDYELEEAFFKDTILKDTRFNFRG